jgi:hypothetical protein
MANFWDVSPSSLVDIDDVSEVILMMEAVSSSETLVSMHQTTRRNIPEDKNLLGKRANNVTKLIFFRSSSVTVCF